MNWISFSGGISSAVTALLAHERGVPFQCLFADTLIEDEDLHRFTDDVERAIGQPIIRLKDGRNPWQVFRDVRYHGNTRTAHCSSVLKTDVVRTYLDTHADPMDPLILGMDVSESERASRAAERWAPRPVLSWLAEWSIYRPQYAGVLARHNIKPPVSTRSASRTTIAAATACGLAPVRCGSFSARFPTATDGTKSNRRRCCATCRPPGHRCARRLTANSDI